MSRKVIYSFTHHGGNKYDILYLNRGVIFSGKANGVNAFVVDKQRTALMTKETTNIDAFLKKPVIDDMQNDWGEYWCMYPDIILCDPLFAAILDEITNHQANILTKLIVE